MVVPKHTGAWAERRDDLFPRVTHEVDIELRGSRRSEARWARLLLDAEDESMRSRSGLSRAVGVYYLQ